MGLKTLLALVVAILGLLSGATPSAAASRTADVSRPQGPCDIYDGAGTPCVAAHSTTRALYERYHGPLYRIERQSDGRQMDIGVVEPSVVDAGGYANAPAQDAFCRNTYCWIAILYDQSGHHNDLSQPPRGAFSGPAMGGFNNLPIADWAPVTVMGHKVYGVFIAPGMGLRLNDAKGTAVDDQAEGQYWVINGQHFNSGCCFDYGNAEIDSRDDDNGTMETTYYGDATPWYHGNPPGPWIMTDQENNLVGCVNPDRSKLCTTLPNISWRFVTGIAKGKPHHWTSMGGDAQRGPLTVMYDGKRIDSSYDPMRKQGAILLGNGGDNSNGSQGTFYEGAMTAAGTFPSDATDQQVQGNVVAARYGVARLIVTPGASVDAPTGVQTFAPGSRRKTTVTFTNTSDASISDLRLTLVVPDATWNATAVEGAGATRAFAGTIAPGSSVHATFTVTSGSVAYNGDISAQARWTDGHRPHTDSASLKVRNTPAIKINEFRVSDGSANTTNGFIELYNAGEAPVDMSGWTLTEHGAQQPIFSSIHVPADTTVKPGGFYLLGLANSGLALPSRVGDRVIHVRNVEGMHAGAAITIGTDTDREERHIADTGTAAGLPTTIWQPLPDGPVITIPAGATNIPVSSIDGIEVGQKIAIGYGATYPAVGLENEHYEVATVAAIGRPGAQEYLLAEAHAGATTLQVSSVESIAVGETIRLDIASQDHGIENVTVKRVGTAAARSNLAADVRAGATEIVVRSADNFKAGDRITVGTPVSGQVVTIASVGVNTAAGAKIVVAPAIARDHVRDEWVVDPGTGVEITRPLQFTHAANLPFAVRGSGITLATPTMHIHRSNEPIQPLGTGLTLDRPLERAHLQDAVVRDATVTAAGYQGAAIPAQWFGGPTLSATAGSMVLRDAGGLVVDTLNYGGVVDPWAAKGNHALSGAERSGCFATTPGLLGGWPPVTAISGNVSVARYPDGADTDSNCNDLRAPAFAVLPLGASAGATVLKVTTTAAFAAGQRVMIGSGEIATIAAVGTPGATMSSAAVRQGDTTVTVVNARGFVPGQVISIENEQATVVTAHGGPEGGRIVVERPFATAHPFGVGVSGSGLKLASPLRQAQPIGAQVVGNVPTPGEPNRDGV